MLQSINDLHRFTIHATDGEIGTVEDLYFDDLHWTIRYLVVDTGNWLTGRCVLISPTSAKGVDWTRRTISVDLTSDQVKKSPDVGTNRPVSRQHEEELSAYYGWPYYWTMEPLGFEPMAIPLPLSQSPAERPAQKDDPHLRSVHEVKGYHIAAVDGSVGHVSNFVFDDGNWKIAFLVVDAGSWLHHRLVLLKPDWIEAISWDDRRVAVRLTREAVRTSPEFTPAFPISAEYAEELLKHYQQAG